MKIIHLTIALVFLNCSCSLNSHTNVALGLDTPPPKVKRASFHVKVDRGDDKTLFILALSGGGSRAAYFSSMTMLRLQEVFAEQGLDLLGHVDAITSVSGGSLPAAYYEISQDVNQSDGMVVSGRLWNRATVKELMSRNFIRRWIANWFWPENFVKYWFTAYDRSDAMAQTFADNLFDQKSTGWDLSFADINPERPYIVINSTNGTRGKLGEPFTFTEDDFSQQLDSDIYQYDIARAVMASASFPAVFNCMTLRDYNHENKYLHVFDGGVRDNLGLSSAERIIQSSIDGEVKYNKIVVFIIDAFTQPQGISDSDYDGRNNPVDYIIDVENGLQSTDAMLKELRKKNLHELSALLRKYNSRKDMSAMMYHLKFSDLSQDNTKITQTVWDQHSEEDVIVSKPLHSVLNNISTSLSISDNHTRAIEKAVDLLVVKENSCLTRIKNMIENNPEQKSNDVYCQWKKPDLMTASPGASGSNNHMTAVKDSVSHSDVSRGKLSLN